MLKAGPVQKDTPYTVQVHRRQAWSLITNKHLNNDFYYPISVGPRIHDQHTSTKTVSSHMVINSQNTHPVNKVPWVGGVDGGELLLHPFHCDEAPPRKSLQKFFSRVVFSTVLLPPPSTLSHQDWWAAINSLAMACFWKSLVGSTQHMELFHTMVFLHQMFFSSQFTPLPIHFSS